MDSDTPGVWETDAALKIDDWAHRTLLKEDWDGWVMYNDEPPGGKASGSVGHCKGVVAWNSDKAGWLIHSVPLWPPAFGQQLDGREILDNIRDDQVKFGQSFAWVDVARTDLAKVLDQVCVMQPAAYCVNDGQGLWESAKRAHGPRDISWTDLGAGVRHVAKRRQWGRCLFEEALVREAGGACLAETWCRPKPRPTERVWNAVVLGWPDTTPLVAYHESQDHSKYAVSEGADRPWTYVGDINNMKSQWKRGGGGLVFSDPGIHRAFRSLIHTDDRILG
ncbi:hypothetical protein WJX74_004527 [Apatococcus lobatus]|uniref:Uncharacterized protein n=1 Tax=Apatococcus lobatus TaxID=904363 RepID=A0AAW1QZR3_9CHLO